MTNKQLARWLSQGLGQIRINSVVYSQYHYPIEMDNEPVPRGITIRLWGSKLWEEPRFVPTITEGQTT